MYIEHKADPVPGSMPVVDSQIPERLTGKHIKLISATETLGLFMASKADGIVKLMMPFPGYEDLKGVEFKLGDSRTKLEGEKLAVGHGE